MSERQALWSDLLSRANRGDSAAYGQFLTEVSPALRTIARGRLAGGTAEEIEDIVQEALLALHAKRHTWREGEPVAPWLYAIARYKVADAARRRRAHGGVNSGAHVQIDELADVLPDERGEETLAARDLDRLLEGIDDRSAGIVRSVGLEGDSAGEVGDRLGLSAGAVRVAYHRAMKRLRKLAQVEEDEPVKDDAKNDGAKQDRTVTEDALDERRR